MRTFLLEEVDLHVTNRCINQCPHCNASSPEVMEEISTERMCRFLEEARELGVEHLHITGGEPFFREDIFTILGKAQSLGIKVEIITSIKLSPENMRQLKAVGVEYLTISLDGVEEYHDKLRRKGSFQNSLENIKNAHAAGLKVRANTFIWKENVAQVTELFHLTASLGVEKHVVFYFTPMGRGQEHLDLWMNLSEWRDFFVQTKKYIQTRLIPDPAVKTSYILQKSFYDDVAEMQASDVSCRLKNRSACVLLCDGTLYPCVIFMRSDKALGNITGQSLKDIWQNSEMWSYYTAEVNTDSACTTCQHLEMCDGGCMGYSYIMKKDNTLGDVRCKREESIYPSCVWMTEQIK